MSIKTRYILFWCAITFIGCANPTESHVEHQLLEKCIKAHGGLDNWNALNEFRYTKKVTLFTESKTIEKELFQTHKYHYGPNLSGTITWKDSIKKEIRYEKDKAFRVQEGINSPPDQTSLNTFNSAFYVLNMPWKLKDPGAKISYIGVDTILNNQAVHTLKVEYPKAIQQDVWKYYLDINDYHLVANLVQHGSTYSLITNDEMEWHKDLLWNSKRSSYRSDSLGNILFLRAKYVYEYIK